MQLLTEYKMPLTMQRHFQTCGKRLKVTRKQNKNACPKNSMIESGIYFLPFGKDGRKSREREREREFSFI